MEIQFMKFNSKIAEGEEFSDPEAYEEIQRIAQAVCSYWNDIIRCLGEIGYRLADHYGNIVSICRRHNLIS